MKRQLPIHFRIERGFKPDINPRRPSGDLRRETNHTGAAHTAKLCHASIGRLNNNWIRVARTPETVRGPKSIAPTRSWVNTHFPVGNGAEVIRVIKLFGAEARLHNPVEHFHPAPAGMRAARRRT